MTFGFYFQLFLFNTTYDELPDGKLFENIQGPIDSYDLDINANCDNLLKYISDHYQSNCGHEHVGLIDITNGLEFEYRQTIILSTGSEWRYDNIDERIGLILIVNLCDYDGKLI